MAFGEDGKLCCLTGSKSSDKTLTTTRVKQEIKTKLWLCGSVSGPMQSVSFLCVYCNHIVQRIIFTWVLSVPYGSSDPETTHQVLNHIFQHKCASLTKACVLQQTENMTPSFCVLVLLFLSVIKHNTGITAFYVNTKIPGQ